MDKKKLSTLSKNELIRIILELEKRISQLEQFFKAFDNPHTPSSKQRSKENTVHDEETRFPGKPKGSNGGGIDMPKPDREESVMLERCPECNKKLGKPCDIYRFRQMDIPVQRFVTTQYIVSLYKCSCGAEVDAGEHLHKGFYGPNVTALTGCLKREGLSYEAIAYFLHDSYHLPISDVGIYNKLSELTNAMADERECIRHSINDAEFVHMDETGLREDGKNGFVWNASTPSHCLFEYDRSRSSDVAKRILNNFNGTIVTDDYKGYLWYQHRQLCWSHLLREAKEFSKYDGARVQYERLKMLYDKAKRAQQLNNSRVYNNLVWELEDIAQCYHALDGCKIMHGKLHNRSHLWLLGVKQKNVPLTNNHAERCLRHIVLQRNRIGCIRNERGELFVNVFLSCTSTWKLQGKSVFNELLKHSS